MRNGSRKFGHDGGQYDFNANDVEWLQASLEKVKTERDELEAKVTLLAQRLAPVEAEGKPYLNECLFPDCNTWVDGDDWVQICGFHAFKASLKGYEYYLINLAPRGIPEPDGWFDWAKRRPKSHAHGSPCVYYLNLNGFVKIGTTVNLKKRFVTYHVEHDALLAVEPGGIERERERHQQFAATRRGKRELFERTPELEAHIALARETFGDPLAYMT